MLNIGSRLELFVDDALIQELNGVEQRLHSPVPRELALVHDMPWEGNSCGYYTVFQDETRFRMYYRGGEQILKGEPPAHPPVACYAESADGVHWHKPTLGLVEYDGSRKNNIVMRDGAFGNTLVPFLDSRPDCPPESRYKAVAAGKDAKGKDALFAFHSADGLRWSAMSAGPITRQGMFDSQNLAFWDPLLGQYRAYWRAFRDPATDTEVNPTIPGHPRYVRDIVTAVSDDFLHWSDPLWLRYPGVPDEELYTNQVLPYFRAPHILLGFPTRYLDRGWSVSTEALPGLEHRRLRAASSPREGSALTDGLFMSSRDGRTFRRWREAFLRPGLRTANNWTYGDNYQCWGIIQTPAVMDEAPDELSFFASEKYWLPGASRLRRFTLRMDGFVSVQAPAAGGELLTRPLVFAGARLALNFSTSAAGSVRVEIQDETGRPLAGFALEDCDDLFGDDLERTLSWKGRTDVSALAGRPVRLRFSMADADVYSLRFCS